MGKPLWNYLIPSCLKTWINEIYSGPKANFRAVHDHLMHIIHGFGEFEVAPKKGYLSLRRKKQFIMIGPASNTRFELGLNIKRSGRKPEESNPQPKGSMCDVKVVINSIEEIDQPLIDCMKRTYERLAEKISFLSPHNSFQKLSTSSRQVSLL